MARLSTNPNDFCFADIPLTRVMQWAIEPTYLASAANNPQLCLKRRTEGGRMIAGLTHLALAATLAGAAGDQLFPWNKQKREFHAKTFAFAGIPSSPAIFGRRKQHHPSLGGELLLTLRQQTRNHHLLREWKGGSHRGFTCGKVVRSISGQKMLEFSPFAMREIL